MCVNTTNSSSMSDEAYVHQGSRRKKKNRFAPIAWVALLVVLLDVDCGRVNPCVPSSVRATSSGMVIVRSNIFIRLLSSIGWYCCQTFDPSGRERKIFDGFHPTAINCLLKFSGGTLLVPETISSRWAAIRCGRHSLFRACGAIFRLSCRFHPCL